MCDYKVFNCGIVTYYTKINYSLQHIIMLFNLFVESCGNKNFNLQDMSMAMKIADDCDSIIHLYFN